MQGQLKAGCLPPTVGEGREVGTMKSHTPCVLCGCSIKEKVYVQESVASREEEGDEWEPVSAF